MTIRSIQTPIHTPIRAKALSQLARYARYAQRARAHMKQISSRAPISRARGLLTHTRIERIKSVSMRFLVVSVCVSMCVSDVSTAITGGMA